jgi:hypothetical protein
MHEHRGAVGATKFLGVHTLMAEDQASCHDNAGQQYELLMTHGAHCFTPVVVSADAWPGLQILSCLVRHAQPTKPWRKEAASIRFPDTRNILRNECRNAAKSSSNSSDAASPE